MKASARPATTTMTRLHDSLVRRRAPAAGAGGRASVVSPRPPDPRSGRRPRRGRADLRRRSASRGHAGGAGSARRGRRERDVLPGGRAGRPAAGAGGRNRRCRAPRRAPLLPSPQLHAAGPAPGAGGPGARRCGDRGRDRRRGHAVPSPARVPDRGGAVVRPRAGLGGRPLEADRLRLAPVGDAGADRPPRHARATRRRDHRPPRRGLLQLSRCVAGDRGLAAARVRAAEARAACAPSRRDGRRDPRRGRPPLRQVLLARPADRRAALRRAAPSRRRSSTSSTTRPGRSSSPPSSSRIFTSYGDFLVEGALTVDMRYREEVGAFPGCAI